MKKQRFQRQHIYEVIYQTVTKDCRLIMQRLHTLRFDKELAEYTIHCSLFTIFWQYYLVKNVSKRGIMFLTSFGFTVSVEKEKEFMQSTVSALLLITSAVVLCCIVINLSVSAMEQTLITNNPTNSNITKNLESSLNDFIDQTNNSYNQTNSQTPTSPTPDATIQP